MTPQKLNKAFSLARLDDMQSVRAHIEKNLQQQSAALAALTSRQLAAVIQVHHAAYKQGRASCGAELTGDGAVWIGGNVQRLIDLDRLRAMTDETPKAGRQDSPAPSEIRAVRKAVGLTQTEAAALIHSTLRAWQEWEAGNRKMLPGLWELFRLKAPA